MARDVMILMRALSITRAIGRGLDLEIETFGPEKVEILGPTPSNGPSNGFARINNIKSKNKKNRYIINLGWSDPLSRLRMAIL